MQNLTDLGIGNLAIVDALQYLSSLDDCTTLGHTRAISTNLVLFRSWQPRRFEDSLNRLKLGEKAPAIQVNRYVIADGPYAGQQAYGVDDGNHRTAAAQQLGRRSIIAHIGTEYYPRPAIHVMDGDRLWRKMDHGRLSLVHANPDEERSAALVALGVEVREERQRIFATATQNHQ